MCAQRAIAKLVCGLTIVTAALVLVSSFRTAQSGDGSKTAAILDVSGAIGPATSEYVRNGIDRSSQQGAELVLLRLDTPGGLDSAMREIVSKILRSPIPVIAFVSPPGARAASAGTYIVYASHLAAMAPSTHLGAATPIPLGGSFGRPDVDEKTGENAEVSTRNAGEAKAVNDAVAYVRGLAQLRGRNAEWAESAVRQAATVTAAEAKSEGIVEIVADDMRDLLAEAHGRIVDVEGRQVRLQTRNLNVSTIEPGWRTRILATLANPNVAYILLLLGLYGILFELISPGSLFPGVIGGISLLVGLYALNLLPVNYAGVGLLLLGIALMVAEALLPSFGVMGIGGIIAFAAGSLFLFRADVPGFRVSWSVVATATAASAGFLVIALGAAWRAHRRKVVTGEAALLGSMGQVLSWGGRAGEIQIRGERWAASSTSELSPGDRVRVTARRDLRLVVEPAVDPGS